MMKSAARDLMRKSILWCVATLAFGLLFSCSKPSEAPPPSAPTPELAAPKETPPAAPTQEVSAPKEETPREKVVVTFWHAMSAKHQECITEIIKAFEMANPDIDVQDVYQGDYTTLNQKVVAALTTSPPTLAQMYESWTTQYLERKRLVPVQNFFSGPDGFTKEELEDIPAVFRQDSTWGQTMVTIPFNKSAYVLFYNEDMLKRAGFDGPPKTWDEMREMAIKLTVTPPGAPKPEVYGLGIRSNIESFTTQLYLNDGSYMDRDFKQLLFNSKEGLEALQSLADLAHKDHVAMVDPAYFNGPFGSEKIAMYTGSTAAFPFNDKAVGNKFTWRAAPMPHATGKKGRTLFQGTNVGMFAGKSEAEQRAGWKFIKFLTNTENSAKWAIATGYLPIRYSAIKTDVFQKYMASNPNYKVAVDLIDNAVFEPRQAYWETMRQEINREVESALNGRKSPAEALQAAFDGCQKALKEAQQQ
ncbi:MAG: ABC transporter substrate-binding protein [bacterium]